MYFVLTTYIKAFILLYHFFLFSCYKDVRHGSRATAFLCRILSHIIRIFLQYDLKAFNFTQVFQLENMSPKVIPLC